MKLMDMLRGITGEFEVNRVVGAFGAVTYIVSTPIFVAWEILYNHRQFDLIAWCTAYPGGLAVCVGAIAAAVSVKDRNVATAQVVRDTGAMPPTGQPAGTEGDPIIVAGAPAGTPPVRTTPEKKP